MSFLQIYFWYRSLKTGRKSTLFLWHYKHNIMGVLQKIHNVEGLTSQQQDVYYIESCLHSQGFIAAFFSFLLPYHHPHPNIIYYVYSHLIFMLCEEYSNKQNHRGVYQRSSKLALETIVSQYNSREEFIHQKSHTKHSFE